YVGLICKRCNVAELMDEMISIPKGLKALKEMEILQKLLDMLIFVLQHGEYKIVLDIMSSKHVAKLDRTLLRHFIQRIISTISPPVPSDFINRLFDIFKHENAMNAIKNDNVMKNDLLAFVENVRSKQMKYFPDKIKQVIEMIKSDTQSTSNVKIFMLVQVFQFKLVSSFCFIANHKSDVNVHKNRKLQLGNFFLISSEIQKQKKGYSLYCTDILDLAVE
ncbi:hypothetical protein RFI_25213, partial [Reticulomyxa filosa]